MEEYYILNILSTFYFIILSNTRWITTIFILVSSQEQKMGIKQAANEIMHYTHIARLTSRKQRCKPTQKR